MATMGEVEAHDRDRFKPDKEADPLIRIAEALEFIASKMHDSEFELTEISRAVQEISNKS